MRNLLAIALGGAIGSVLRYVTSLATLNVAGQSWLFTGTAAVNVIGCFLIGIAAALLHENPAVSNSMKLFVIVGFLGGFTTFSSFGLEAYDAGTAAFGKILAYTGFQVITGLAAVWIGMSTAEWFS